MGTLEKHFNQIFYFLCASVAFVFLYIGAITFLPIPKENIRFADTALSFLMGTVVGGAYGFLVTGSAINYEKKSSNPENKENK